MQKTDFPPCIHIGVRRNALSLTANISCICTCTFARFCFFTLMDWDLIKFDHPLVWDSCWTSPQSPDCSFPLKGGCPLKSLRPHRKVCWIQPFLDGSKYLKMINSIQAPTAPLYHSMVFGEEQPAAGPLCVVTLPMTRPKPQKFRREGASGYLEAWQRWWERAKRPYCPY